MAWLSNVIGRELVNISGISLSLLLIACVSVLIYLVMKRRKMISMIDQIPGPLALPFFGNILDLAVGPVELFQMVSELPSCYGDSITRFWLGMVPYCMVFEAKAAEAVLSSQKHIDKSGDYEYLHPWIGTGLLTSTGRKWHGRRKLLTPAFHFKILDDFLDVFNKQSAKLMNKLGRKANGESFNIFKDIALCTLDVILETAMGRVVNAQDNSDSEYVKAVYKAGSIIQRRQIRPWLQINLLFRLLGQHKEQNECLRILHNFSIETIKERRKEYKNVQNNFESNNEAKDFVTKKRLAFLDLLVKYSDGDKSISDDDIREEVDTFMFEGSDTTSAAINWSIFLLGSNPLIQEKLIEEMDGIFGESDRPATAADLRQMKFLECCIKEALRLFPSVPIIGRKLAEDEVVGGFRIPAGITVMIMIYKLHRDPKQFPDPEEFKPERFLPDNSINRHPYAYIPFSAGPRNCIGQKFALMEEKVILSSFFRKFRVESLVKKEDLNIVGELILRPLDGNIVKLRRRCDLHKLSEDL